MNEATFETMRAYDEARGGKGSLNKVTSIPFSPYVAFIFSDMWNIEENPNQEDRPLQLTNPI